MVWYMYMERGLTYLWYKSMRLIHLTAGRASFLFPLVLKHTMVLRLLEKVNFVDRGRSLISWDVKVKMLQI